MLSTATVSALSDVDPASIRFGVTGTERSVLSCTGRTKDVDGDGRVDLSCAADPDLTGITCATTTATVSGYLRDGIPFTSQDDITVAGCKAGPTKGAVATTKVVASTTTVATSKGAGTTVSTSKGPKTGAVEKTTTKAKAKGKR